MLAILSWLHMTLISCDMPGKTFLTEYTCFDQTSAGMEICMVISLSYFIMDVISVRSIFIKGRVVLETYAHHSIGIVGILSALVIGRVVGVIVISLLITEISTIFLNNRHIMKELDLSEKYKTLFKMNGYSLLVSFFLCRIVFLGIMLAFYVIPVMFNYDYEQAI